MDERVVRWRVSTREGKLSSSREGERETNEQSTDGPVVDPFSVSVVLARSFDERARGEFRFGTDQSGRREQL